MTVTLKYFIFNTDMGWVGVLSGGNGLMATTLPQKSEGKAYKLLGSQANQAESSPGTFSRLVDQFNKYFSGGKANFSEELDFSTGTLFQARVWEATRLIPCGETRSYLWVARQIRKPRAARAVGQAMGKNPLPIIVPCHRVLASDGGLCGFGGGLEMKKKLLRLESAAASQQPGH